MKGRPRDTLRDRLKSEYHISTKTVRNLGGSAYLMSLDELPRKVLINSLKWKKLRAGRAVCFKN